MSMRPVPWLKPRRKCRGASQISCGSGGFLADTNYVFPVKGNQGTLEKEVQAYFDTAGDDDFLRPEIEEAATSEEGHGRIEHRSYFLSTDLSSLTVGGRWCDLKGIGMVESERHSRDGVSIERWYFITSVDDIESFHQAVRSHWGIENGLHWRLDVHVPRRRKSDSTR